MIETCLTLGGVNLKVVGNRRERRQQVARSRKLVANLRAKLKEVRGSPNLKLESRSGSMTSPERNVPSNDRSGEAGSPDR